MAPTTTRRRVLFTLQPGDGHLPPMLPLSRALRAAGHEVVFATSPAFVSRVEEVGERAVPAGRGWLLSDGPSQPAEPRYPGERPPTFFARLFLGEVAAGMADDLLDIVDDLAPDVIVRDPVEFAGAAVAVRRGVPLATFELTFPLDHHVMTTTGDLHDDAELQRLRDRVGLPPSPDPDWFLGQLQIGTFPAGYGEPAEPHGQRLTIGAHTQAPPATAPVPSWLEGLDDAVYVTFGTVFARAFPEVLTAAAVGASRVGAPTVVSTGNVEPPVGLAATGEAALRVERFVPQDAVLRRCAAAVIHGGTGTTLGALAHGVPVVVIPLGADHGGHARAVTTHGAGIVLHRDGLSAEDVTRAVQQVLDDPSYRAAAERLGRQLAALPGPEFAVRALETLSAATVRSRQGRPGG